MDKEEVNCTFAIVGGGIAGVSCAKSIAFLVPEEKIILITASPLIKAVTNIVPLSKTLMQFDIEEKDTAVLMEAHDSLKIINDFVIQIDSLNKQVQTRNGRIINYKMLCLCNGARPKLIEEHNNFILGIRDTESVLQFSQKIKNSRRIVIVGNGGIATELVNEVDGVEMIWVIKDKHISATFVDPGAAEFFMDKVYKTDPCTNTNASSLTKRMRYTVSNASVVTGGPALGPDWHNNFDVKGTFLKSAKVQIEYECEIIKILSKSEQKEVDPMEEWSIYVELTNGKIIGCDFVVSATGVIPNSDIVGLEDIKKSEDGGLLVDWKLETSKQDIYAAGDVCSAGWELAKHWFQMRLWTQAHQMGRYAAKSMVSKLKNEEFLQDFCFELFTHVTKFFGYKVVLLGLYNGQKLDNNYEILLRMTQGTEYIKLILENGKMQGAVLIGDTDLEEMCENLILNQLDLSIYGEDLLNPDIDIEDYFD
ncbi:pyridine nucleotide-disulfide oxidoreductase domain-containing protein 1-like isoform X1 [Bombus vosnesenskii]|uniref:Pyridine nucleotide-disulfide oxidoreductase domain-containing protein 1 n=1 Tax=Bombus vosnesenskii TaxID=207650 RepID=A0A6J3JR49_9HYME|nr:pyridine nucleotide-disulfide oxidoreductase domain-containing protein 1-like isoform X1 [Bombus vosnesenskii]XP_050475906.1 pyridine nucleotide-disulfide oxidoreductase domain-containing protein 1 [Bombus huntii]